MGCVTAESKLIGGQQDANGCLGSAGYSWSPLKSECIRIWEQSILIEDPTKPYEWSGSYAVFSKDGETVELHLADLQNHPILQRRNDFFEDKDFLLKENHGTWCLTRKKTAK